MGYGNTNSPGAAATVERNGLMSAADKRALEALKGLVPFTLMERTASGNPATFADGLAGDVKNLRVTITPTQSGSGDPSPSNIRPISGVSSVTVTRTGKNLFDPSYLLLCDGWTFSDGAYHGLGDKPYRKYSSTNGGFPLNYRFKPNGRYALSADLYADSSAGLILLFRYTDGTTPPATIQALSGDTFAHKSLISEANKSIESVFASYTHGVICHIKNIQLEEGAAETTYEPYHGASVTVPFVDSANNNAPLTVCGGTLDVTSGTLAVTHKIHTINGTANISSYTNTWQTAVNVYVTTLSDNNVKNVDSHVGAIMISDQYEWFPYDSSYAGKRSFYGVRLDDDYPYVFCFAPNTSRILIKDIRYTNDAVGLKAYFSEHPLHIAYPLETPVTYQLTPQQLSTLSGYNAVSADCGMVSVTYRADPTLAYEELTNAILSAGAGI